MKTNIVVDISPAILYLEKYCFSSYGPKCSWPIKLQDSLKFNISRKKWIIKFIFGMHVNIEVFYKLVLWWRSIPEVSKIASWQCLYNISKKKLNMKLFFCMHINIKISSKLISTLGHLCIRKVAGDRLF